MFEDSGHREWETRPLTEFHRLWSRAHACMHRKSRLLCARTFTDHCRFAGPWWRLPVKNLRYTRSGQLRRRWWWWSSSSSANARNYYGKMQFTRRSHRRFYIPRRADTPHAITHVQTRENVIYRPIVAVPGSRLPAKAKEGQQHSHRTCYVYTYLSLVTGALRVTKSCRATDGRAVSRREISAWNRWPITLKNYDCSTYRTHLFMFRDSGVFSNRFFLGLPLLTVD